MVYCSSCGTFFESTHQLDVHQRHYCVGVPLPSSRSGNAQSSPNAALSSPVVQPAMFAPPMAQPALLASPYVTPSILPSGLDALYDPLRMAYGNGRVGGGLMQDPLRLGMGLPSVLQDPLRMGYGFPGVMQDPLRSMMEEQLARQALLQRGVNPLALPAKDIYMGDMRDQLISMVANLSRMQHEQAHATKNRVEELQEEIKEVKRSKSKLSSQSTPSSSPSASTTSKQHDRSPETNSHKRQKRLMDADINSAPRLHLLPDQSTSSSERQDLARISALPFKSILPANTYILRIDGVEGLDIQVPLHGMAVTIEQYHVLVGSKHWLLESVGREHRRIIINNGEASTLGVSLDLPVEFAVRESFELYIFAIILSNRGSPLLWSPVVVRQEGVWVSALRRTPVDMTKVLELTNSSANTATIRGSIEISHKNDVFAQAESRYSLAQGLHVMPIPQPSLLVSNFSLPPLSAAPYPAGAGALSLSANPNVPTTPNVSLPGILQSQSQSQVLPQPPRPSASLTSGDASKQQNGSGPATIGSSNSSSHPSNAPGAQTKLPSPSLSPQQEAFSSAPMSTEGLKVNFDRDGNVIVPPNFKSISKMSLKISDNKADINVSEMFGFCPPGGRLPPPKSPFYGPNMNQVDIYIDAVCGIPLNSICSRVLVYLLDSVNPNTGNVDAPIQDSASFAQKPALVHYQDLQGSTTSPSFGLTLNGIFVNDRTHAVVVIEYTTEKSEEHIVFGHASLPIHTQSIEGSFLSRVRLGDPRRPEFREVDGPQLNETLRQTLTRERKATETYKSFEVEDTIASQILCSKLSKSSNNRANCCPCSFLMWRIGSEISSESYFPYPNESPLSKQEVLIHQVRRGQRFSSGKVLGSFSEAASMFRGKPQSLMDSLSYVCPYDPKRGFFIHVDEVRRMSNDGSLCAVALEIPVQETDSLTLTLRRNWSSDVGLTVFEDLPRVFKGVQYDEKEFAIFHLLKIKKLDAQKPQIEVIGWSLIKLFFDDGEVVRHGRFVLPWFKGEIPDELVTELETQRMEKVFANWFASNKIGFLNASSTVTVTIGDPLDQMQLLAGDTGQPLRRALLIPKALKDSFLKMGKDGCFGVTQEKVAKSTGVNMLTLEEKVNVALRKFVDEELSCADEL